MSVQTYRGSCHCGDVRFEADIDLEKGAGKCNCSMCAKSRNFGISVKPDAFRLTAGADSLTDYQFNTKSIHWPFCSRCGVRTHGTGDIAEMGGSFVTIRLCALDDVPAEALAAIPVRFSNGRNNDWWHDVTEAEKAVL